MRSTKNRPVHLGAYPMERQPRTARMPDLSTVPPFAPLSFSRPERPESIINAMAEHQAMLDAIRDGLVNRVKAACPADPGERARHIKAFGIFCDASMVGIGPVPPEARLAEPLRNPGVAALREDLATRQTKTLASGIDVIMADLKESMEAPPSSIAAHHCAIVFLIAQPRAPRPDEAGCAWLHDALEHRGALRTSEVAVVIANYIRLLGYDAKAHTATSSDIDLAKLTVAAGLARLEDGRLVNPCVGSGFSVAAVTTEFQLEPDLPLASLHGRPPRRRFAAPPYTGRDYVDGPHPFERLRRVDRPTTFIDEPHIPRVPKRTDMFARAQFGDMGKAVQENAKGGHYARKAAPSMGQRRALGAFLLLQDGEPAAGPQPDAPEANAAAVKAASYFLGADAVGLSRCPDWAWYSHDATGAPIDPPHGEAISMIVDQGFETMEGASGDDWISVAQSMRAYLRFSLIGGVIARQLRNLGYPAKAHTVLDGDVLQPPLLLLSGLGEVSRIGEVILNPFLGPRLKSGVVTTTMPLAHDRPIDFGLQRFCESCNKCARECPSGAITAGPKLMFNGYEIWKSDSQKCATYRITTKGGAMCGRCMKTCPWNLEGLFAEVPFRWAAMNVPAAAPLLARLDDWVGNGGLNPTKTWWWDLELAEDGGYRAPRHPVNRRHLQRDLKLRYEDQTLAVYPANLAPPPHPYPYPMDREAGIAAYRALVSAKEHQERLARGDTSHLHRTLNEGASPVTAVVVARAERISAEVTRFVLRDPSGADLPCWEAGAHIDVVVAPEYLRQYSLAGNPAQRTAYEIAVLREPGGRGGSALMHRIFTEGRRVFVSRPINHFPLDESARRTLLFGGGIGVTPLIAMAHRLAAIDADFTLHYSVRSRAAAAYLADLTEVAWADRVRLHVSEEGTRADLATLIPAYVPDDHIYACGPERFMSAVIEAAEAAGFPDEARHLEYFAVPERPAAENHPFVLRLRSGREVEVAASESAAEALRRAGVPVHLKCADGLCGVCRCTVVSGKVDHRDLVLSAGERREMMILCQSRAVEPGGLIEVALEEASS